MSSIDVLVLSLLGVVAAYPAIVRWGASALEAVRPVPAPQPVPWVDDADEWRQRWMGTLITLLGELENRPDGHPSEPAETLCRELMWEVIGGQPDEKQVKK
jgi:hypothetical protein